MCTGLEIALLAGTTMAATGSLMQGYQTKKYQEFQASQDEQQAKGELASAEIEAQNIRRAVKSQIGATRAAYAASGVQAGSGTPLVVEKDINQAGESDALMAVLGGRNRSSSLRASAGAYRASGDAAMTGSYLNAGGTLLSGAYQAGKGWSTQKVA